MTQSRIHPERTDPRFLAQHLSAYAFVQSYAAGRRVLEIGFGDGYGSAHLAGVARHVVAVDLEFDPILPAAAKYRRPNLQFLQMEATRLAFPAASFDLVCSFQVIEHIPEPLLPAYLREIARVLRPEGLCCLSTLNLAHNLKPGRPYEKLACHHKEFTAPELDTLLRRTFPAVELRGLHLTPRHRVMQRLKKWELDRWPLRAANPVRRFFETTSTDHFHVTTDCSTDAIDLIALCRLTPR